jgi:alkylhydroperoxidase family enzyme
MANDIGFLTKAKRENLDAAMQRRLAKWHENGYADDNFFLVIARRPGLMDVFWNTIKYWFGGGSTIEPQLFELVRKRLALNNECHHCSAVQVASASDQQTQDELMQKLFDYESSDLPERTKAALRFADRLSGEHTKFDEVEFAALKQHFNDDEILDLGATIGMAIGWQRFNGAMRLLPDNWGNGGPLPWEKVVADDKPKH